MGITMIATGAFRETGASFFFIPKGALTHHLVVTSSISLAPPQGGRSRSFRCSSSPRKAGFAGTPVRRWYPSLRSGRALCEADRALCGERQPMPSSLRASGVIACAEKLCAVSPPAANLQPAALSQLWTDASPHRPFSFAAPKETKPPLAGAERT